MARGSYRLGCAAALGCWLMAGAARAHEPFEITADARASLTETTLRLLIAGHTAELLCGELPDLANAEPWRRCGAALFTVTGAEGRRLAVRAVAARVTVENDVAVTVTFPPPDPGALHFEATFLRRLADPTYGALLTVTGPGVFLGQKLLRAGAPSAVVVIPSPPGRSRER